MSAPHPGKSSDDKGFWLADGTVVLCVEAGDTSGPDSNDNFIRYKIYRGLLERLSPSAPLIVEGQSSEGQHS